MISSAVSPTHCTSTPCCSPKCSCFLGVLGVQTRGPSPQLSGHIPLAHSHSQHPGCSLSPEGGHFPLSFSRPSFLFSPQGYFRIWIPIYSQTAHPLYGATKGNIYEPLDLPHTLHKLFAALQKALTQALAYLYPIPMNLSSSSQENQPLRLLAHLLVTPSFLQPVSPSSLTDPTRAGPSASKLRPAWPY